MKGEGYTVFIINIISCILLFISFFSYWYQEAIYKDEKRVLNIYYGINKYKYNGDVRVYSERNEKELKQFLDILKLSYSFAVLCFFFQVILIVYISFCIKRKSASKRLIKYSKIFSLLSLLSISISTLTFIFINKSFNGDCKKYIQNNSNNSGQIKLEIVKECDQNKYFLDKWYQNGFRLFKNPYNGYVFIVVCCVLSSVSNFLVFFTSALKISKSDSSNNIPFKSINNSNGNNNNNNINNSNSNNNNIFIRYSPV